MKSSSKILLAQKTSEVIESKFNNDSRSVKVKWNKKKVIQSLVIACATVGVVLLMLFFIEGNHFLKSIPWQGTLKWQSKSPEQKSWFGFRSQSDAVTTNNVRESLLIKIFRLIAQLNFCFFYLLMCWEQFLKTKIC